MLTCAVTLAEAVGLLQGDDSYTVKTCTCNMQIVSLQVTEKQNNSVILVRVSEYIEKIW